jgi:hypothetical protein
MHHGIERVEHTIEIDEALNLHKTGWTIQRIGLTFFMLIVILALLGMFGNGILGYRKTEAAGNMVEYERYGRFQNSTSIHFLANNENGRAVVHIPQQYLQDFELQKITPEPDQQTVLNGHYVYSFQANKPVHILLRGMPKKRGAIEAVVRVNNTQFTLSQFIFP